MKIAVYISGHGFGHLAQLAPVMNRIHAIRPDVCFLLCTSLPVEELRARLDFSFEHLETVVDVGVIQRNAIEEDRDASIAAMREWVACMDEQVELHAGYLKRFAADLVISNISPLAFPAARRAGIPALALASLDWHSIYSHWLEPDDPVLGVLEDAYRDCSLLLAPPMSMPMPLFQNRCNLPLVAGYVGEQGGFCFKPGYQQRVLVIFGGCGQPPFHLPALAAMEDYLFLIPGVPADAPANVQSISFSAQLRPIDLMAQVDLVVCKPGYGILSECWRTRTPIAWVERPEFPEFPVLRQWLETSMPACGMSRESFAKGEWQTAMAQALSSSRAYPMACEDGALVAAEAILSYSAD